MTLVDDAVISIATEILPPAPIIWEQLTDGEKSLVAILQDKSGIDVAEFLWVDENKPDRCWRAYPFQWSWWRDLSYRAVDACGRSVGKSTHIEAMTCAFPFNFPGEEHVIITPESSHMDELTDRIQNRIHTSRLLSEMVEGGAGSRGGITHRPFRVIWANGARTVSKLPQRSGIGVKGCVGPGTLILTDRGLVPVEHVTTADRVWTHRCRWQQVLVAEPVEAPVAHIQGDGGFPMIVTSDHRIWGRRNSAGPGEPPDPGPWQWASVDGLAQHQGDPRFYWGGPGGTTFDPGQALPVPTLPAACPDEAATWRAIGRMVGRGEPTAPELAAWAREHFPEQHGHMVLPSFVLFLPADHRGALLGGVADSEVESSSKAYVLSVGLLAQSLGRQAGYACAPQTDWYKVGFSKQPVAAKVDRVAYRLRSIRIQRDDDPESMTFGEANEVATTYSIVTDDASYIGDGIVHHNTHPVWLTIDEAQDLSDRTWKELPETVRKEVPGALWRAHGVSKGVRDNFYEISQPDSGWKVWQITGLHSPDWDESERPQKIKDYGGSMHSEDWKRNVYGQHGETMNRIFILLNLMAGVDKNEGSFYNTEEFYERELTAGEILAETRASDEEERSNIQLSTEEQVRAMISLLDLPTTHKSDTRYKTIWMGMDVGLVADPSEILVAAEYEPTTTERREDENRNIRCPPKGLTRLKLLARISTRLVPSPMQARLIMFLIDFYGPRKFSMDSTGIGLPLFQELQQLSRQSRLFTVEEAAVGDLDAVEEQRQARKALTVIKGYNFSQKSVVEINEKKADLVPVGATPQEVIEIAGERRNIKDAGTEELRTLVDNGRWMMPQRKDIINQMNGQTWQQSQEAVDAFGRRRMTYSVGVFHLLDAARMLAIGRKLEAIETLMMAAPAKREDIIDRFGW